MAKLEPNYSLICSYMTLPVTVIGHDILVAAIYRGLLRLA